MGSLRRARGDRRRPQAPVGRSRAREKRRASRGIRLRRLARKPLLSWRVSDRTSVPSAAGVRHGRRVVRRFWYITLRQYAGEHTAEKPYERFTIPFVDYGRGDGLSVGPGQDME